MPKLKQPKNKQLKIKQLDLTNCPKISKRRPYALDDRVETSYYLESDRDFMENNRDACIWFLEQLTGENDA